jgi:pimeloyl-ACP methyl ester carboxylesterase
MKPPPVVMVHGAFCGGWVFERFAGPFMAAGHETHCLDLRADSSVAGLSMSEYARRVADFAGALEDPPVLIGHSLGGLVCLLAAANVRTAGLVLLAPSAPWGVVASTMEEAVSALALYALGPYWALAIEPEYATFGRYAVDRLARAERHALFGRMSAESGRALFETLNWWLDPFMTTLARPERISAPILALSGARDAIHPPATVAETARRVGAEHVVMPAMSHWLPAEPGWEAVADRCLAWLGAEAAPLAAE